MRRESGTLDLVTILSLGARRHRRRRLDRAASTSHGRDADPSAFTRNIVRIADAMVRARQQSVR